MKSLAWKLATIAAVIGIGFLVLLQAQRGMNQAVLTKQTEPPPATAATPGPAAPDAAASTGSPATKPDATAELPSQLEPAGGNSKPAPAAPAATASTLPGESPKPDAGVKPLKTAQIATPPGKNVEPPANDPFAESNDSKRPGAPSLDLNASTKTAAPSSVPDLKPAGDATASGGVKQASASEETSKPEPGADKKPSNGPSIGSPTGSPASPPTLTDPKPPGGQAEPGDAPASGQPPRPNDTKTDSAKPGNPGKDPATNAINISAGPQLLAPDAGQEPPAASGNSPTTPSGPPPKMADPKTSAAPSPPAANDAKNGPSIAQSGKGGAEAGPFPALDEQPTPPAAAPSGTPGTKSPPAQPPAPGHPDLFPVDQTKEVPLAKSLDPKTPESRPITKLPEPTIEAPSSSLKTADSTPANGPTSGAAGGLQRIPRASGEPRPDPAPDFQGDGTVSEQAPLGPQRPQLSIEKVAPPNALLGQPLVYSILVRNVGASEAHDVVVDDRIPKGTKLSGTNPQAEMTGKRLIWRIGNLAPNEQRRISIRVIPLEAGEIGSVATVNFVSEVAAATVVTAPRIEFELSAPRNVKLGQVVPFHFKVTNVGTGEARGVVIRDLIPEGLAHDSGNDLEYPVGRLPAGQSKDLTLDLKATKIGPIVNRALVVGDGGLSVKAEAALEISGTKIALSRSGPSRRYLGRAAIYSNTLINESKYDVEGVVAVETVPPGMDFAAATHGGQFNEGTRTIAWRIERMAPGETCVLKSKLMPKSVGTQPGTVRVSVPNGEPAEAASATVVEGFAALGVDVAGADGPIDVGEKVTLRVNARNKGTIPATNVVLTIDIPEQMTIVSVRGPGKRSQQGNHVQFGPIATLEGRTAAMCEVVLQANKRGDSRIHVSLQADQIDKPLTREESVLVLSESAEPAASR